MVTIKSLYLTVLLSLFAFPAFGQTITITQLMTFGTIAIDNLNDNVSLNIRNNGGCNLNGNTFEIEPCMRAEFLITGGPPNSTYTVTTPSSTTLTGPGPASFTMNNFRVSPNSLVTDAAGSDTFRVMARIVSTSGDNFGDGTYSDTFNITVNF